MTTACMGGWCAKRDHCMNYHAEQRTDPAERLCVPGQDGTGAERPVPLHRAAGSWEREPGFMAVVPWEALG